MSFSPGSGASQISTSGDVALNNPSTGDVLSYNGAISKWQNQTINGQGGAVSSVAGKTGVVTLAESDIANLTTDLSSKRPIFGDAGIKSTNYTANPWEIVRVDVSSGSLTITLPTAVTKWEIVVKIVTAPASLGSTSVNVAAQGSDIINKAGVTSLPLRYLNQSKTFTSNGNGTIIVTNGDLDKAILDQLYHTYFSVKAYGATGDGTTNDTAAITATITACKTAGGGTVYFPTGTYITNQLTLPSLVSLRGESRKDTVLQLAANAGSSIIISDGFSANTNGVGGSAWGTGNPTVPSYFNIETMTLDGNAVNQPTPPTRSDWREDSALIKLWGYHMTLRDLELNNAWELALYTEHYGNWETTFNQYQFAESSFENIYAKNYWATGWINRGPHDSSIRNVYLSAYTSSGSYALYGYLQQGSGSNYSTGGTVANNLHVWGEHTQNAVYIDSSNIVEGWIYAEGCSQAAIKLVNASSCSFRAFVGYCTDGIELFSGNNNRVMASVESNVSGSLFKLRAAAGNYLEQAPGGNATTAVFDLTTGTGNYTGGNNILKSARPYATTLITGTAAASDYIDAIADASSATNRVTNWQLPVGANAVKISNTAGTVGSVNLGTLELQGAGVRFAAASKTAAYTATDQDMLVLASAATVGFTVTLPTAVGRTGKLFAVKKTDSSANIVTVGTTSSQTIDGTTILGLGVQYNYVLVVSDGANWSVIGSSTGGTGATPTNVQVFTSSGTWTKPSGAVLIEVELFAGGGGGGSGRRGAVGSARYGGGGGGGGGHTRSIVQASALASTVNVTIGSGGSGATAPNTDDTSGSNGGSGTATVFGTYVARGGGVGQAGGITSAAAPTSAGGGTFVGAIGTATNLGSGAAGLSGAGAASSGGGGGGITTANVIGTGGTAPSAWDRNAFFTLAGGITPGGNGNKGTDRATTDIGGGDGGSGGAAGAADASSAGGTGGAGSFPGGGGGGGGASTNGIVSGTGGNGAPGLAVVITRF